MSGFITFPASYKGMYTSLQLAISDKITGLPPAMTILQKKHPCCLHLVSILVVFSCTSLALEELSGSVVSSSVYISV